MMKCRMCSQRLTQPGKLCRECESELESARTAAAAGALSPAVPLLEANPLEALDADGARGRWRSRPAMLVAAFAAGIAAAAVVHVATGGRSPAAPGSPLIDVRSSADAPDPAIPVSTVSGAYPSR